MFKVDLGINLAKEISAYLKASGKKNILQTNPIQHLNFKGIKYAPATQADNLVLSEASNFIKKHLLYSAQIKTRLNVGGILEDFIKFDGSQMGTNPAFWAQNQRTGELMYVKYGSIYGNAKHLKSEVIASKLYNLAGIKTPEMQLGKLEDGTTCIISKFVPGLKELKKTEAQEAFAADAWLANWDSVLNGNTLSSGGKCVKIDCGGALNYRALGKEKTNFGNNVGELISLVDGRNYESTYFYCGMSHKALVNSFKKVTSITDEAIKQVAADENLAKTLINRKNYMRKILNEIEITPFNGESLANYLKKCAELAKNKKNFS